MKTCLNILFVGQYRTKESGHNKKKNLQEKENSSGINLLPDYKDGKQYNRWFSSFKFKSYWKLLP